MSVFLLLLAMMMTTNNHPFIMDAFLLTSRQSCRRQPAFQRDWKVRKWRPKSILNACLRDVILLLSDGKAPEEVATRARQRIVEQATEPGLDVPRGMASFDLVQDIVTLVTVLAHAFSRMALMKVTAAKPMIIGPGVVWKPLSWADDSGSLHRWVFVDRISDTDIDREMHSWYVAGDIMMLRANMTVHLVEVGRMREEHWRSAWTTAYQHPTMGTLRPHFLSPKGQKLGGWTAVYLNALRRANRISTEEWIEQLFAEGMAQRLVKHVNFSVPDDTMCRDTQRQILAEAEEMKRDAGLGAFSLPMSRGSCDGMVPCPWQEACYAPQPVEMAKLGLYEPRVVAKVPLQREAIVSSSRSTHELANR